jgi:2-keto-4-pentenoate hydratase/2-oxohepta-3-ene-1,7-dioic acid hydratase in catechol pathway
MKVATPEYPEVFLKPATTITTATGSIIIPKSCHNQVDGEVELAIIIGRDCKDLTLQNAMDHVLGYTVANDVTARKFQARGSQWGFSKGFDTFCPLGPVVVSRQYLPDPKVLELKTVLNGKVMQNGEARNMIFSIEDILVYLSNVSSTQRRIAVITIDLSCRDTLCKRVQ